MKKLEIEVDLKTVVEGMTYNDKQELLRYLLFDSLSKEDFNTFFRWIFNNFKSSEIEFNNRTEVIKAYETLIKAHK